MSLSGRQLERERNAVTLSFSEVYWKIELESAGSSNECFQYIRGPRDAISSAAYYLLKCFSSVMANCRYSASVKGFPCRRASLCDL